MAGARASFRGFCLQRTVQLARLHTIMQPTAEENGRDFRLSAGVCFPGVGFAGVSVVWCAFFSAKTSRLLGRRVGRIAFVCSRSCETCVVGKRGGFSYMCADRERVLLGRRYIRGFSGFGEMRGWLSFGESVNRETSTCFAKNVTVWEQWRCLVRLFLL